MKRKPRVTRPRHKRINGYASICEYLLHDTILNDWSHHADKVNYVVEHSYEPDFVRTLQNKKILLESKGRFWDHAEYSKYKWFRENLPEDTELVFLFANPSAPMPNSKMRKDGTKRTHGEWATTNNFRWYTEATLPDEWVDMNARKSNEFNERQHDLDKEEETYAR